MPYQYNTPEGYEEEEIAAVIAESLVSQLPSGICAAGMPASGNGAREHAHVESEPGVSQCPMVRLRAVGAQSVLSRYPTPGSVTR